jgi:hypothetical protein
MVVGATSHDRITLRLVVGLLALTLATVIVLALWLAWYAFPRADDMSRAGRANRFGIRASMREEYKFASGRWAGTGLAYVIGAAVNEDKWYGLLLAGIAIVTPLAAYALLGALVGRTLTRAARAGLAIAFFTLFWAGMPSTPDGFYWLTGSLENQLAISLGVLTVAGLLHCGEWVGLKRIGGAAGLAGLAATTVGFHELYGMMLVVTLTVGTALAFITRHANRLVWAWVTSAAAAGLVVVAAAPGNTVRMATMPPGERTLEQLATTAQLWIGFYGSWLFDPKLLAATALLLAVPHFHAAAPDWLLARRALWSTAVPAMSLVLLAIPILVLWWVSTGLCAPGRTRSAIYLLFLFAWFASLFVLLAGRQPAGLPASAQLALAAYLSAGLISTGNFRVAVADLNGSAQAYCKAVADRHDRVRAAVARGVRDIRVPPLPVIPVHFNYDADLLAAGSTAPNAHVNAHAAMYFGLDSIALTTPVANR